MREVTFELVGVPYTSMAKPGGIANGIGVLRTMGLLERAAASGAVHDAGDLESFVGSGERGPSGLLNERALGRLVAATREAVSASLDRGRLPLLVGGDCPVLLGALAAGSDRRGECGLLLVDGHQDAWPPHLSATGEASDSEVAIALGLVEHDLPQPLHRLTPLLAPEGVAMLGPRDRNEMEDGGVQSLAGTVGLFRDDEAVRACGASASAAAAIESLSKGSSAFWLHIDFDVLASDEFAAADYLQPGGLSWEQLLEIATRALAERGCLGASLVIYNPDLDPTRAAAERIVAFVGDLIRAPRSS